MRLRVHRGAAVIEFAPRPSSEGTKLQMSEWNLVCKARDTVDFHMSSHDKSGEDVRVWVLLKNRHDGGVAYLTVKPFRGQMYVHIRDYWYPNGRDGGLALTSRGVTLNREGWNTLVQEMDTMDELWRDANEYLECQSAIRRAPSTLVDTQDEDYHIHFCILYSYVCICLLLIIFCTCIIRICDQGCPVDDFPMPPELIRNHSMYVKAYMD